MKKMSSEQINYVKSVSKNFLEQYKNRKDLDCIYLLSYEENNENIFDLVFVFTKEISKRTIKEFDKLNRCFKKKDSLESFGGVFRLITESNTEYEKQAETLEQLKRVRNLLSSEILYDRNGLYEKIAHQFDSYEKVYQFENTFKLK